MGAQERRSPPKPAETKGLLTISYDIGAGRGEYDSIMMVWTDRRGIPTVINNFFGQTAIDLIHRLTDSEEMRKTRMTDNQGCSFERVAGDTYILRVGTDEVYRGPLKSCIDEYERRLTDPDENDK